MCRSPVAVAQSSSGGVAMHYVLPVLWTMSRLAVMGHTAMHDDTRMESDVYEYLVGTCSPHVVLLCARLVTIMMYRASTHNLYTPCLLIWTRAVAVFLSTSAFRAHISLPFLRTPMTTCFGRSSSLTGCQL